LAVPAAGAGGALLLSSARAVLRWTVAWVAAYGVAVAWAAGQVLQVAPLEAAGGLLRVDALSALHLLIVAMVFGMSSAFAAFYFAREAAQGVLPPRIARRFGALWAAALAAMTVVFCANNLAVMWVGVEFSTLSTAFLIRLHVTPQSLEAMWKYLVVCSVGVALAFLGVVLVAASARGVLASSQDALTWTALVEAAPRLDPALAKMGFLFVLVGFGTKAGLAPMHTWLPDAHSQAPAPVSAVFSGALLNAALYCIMSYLPIVEGASGHAGWALGLLQAFGVVSILVAAVFIVFQRDLKRLLAYSSIEHIGIVCFALAMGPAGAFAGLFHALNHSASKATAFFAAGAIVQGQGAPAGGPQGAGASGAWRGTMALSLLSLAGAGPFAIAASELLVMQAAAGAGAWAALALLVLGVAVAFTGVLKHVVGALHAGGDPAPRPADRRQAAEVACVLAPFVALLVLGLTMPPALRDALQQAAALVGGGAP
jgi:hydrogenase-4 component F